MAAVWDLLTSRSTAIVLLIAVSLIIALGAALPNTELLPLADADQMRSRSPVLFWLGENFNSMKIGKSPAFAAAGMLLVLSTTLCSIDRVVKKYKTGRVQSADIPPGAKGTVVHLKGDVNGVQRLIGLLNQGRWRSTISEVTGGTRISARKGEYGFWGSVFFHAVLVTLIVGLVVYQLTAFYATLVITEGQDLRLTKESLTSIERMPVTRVDIPDLIVKFNKFSEEYYDDITATDYRVDLTILNMKDGRAREQVVRVNRPFGQSGVDFILTRKGESPNFILFKRGTEVFDSYVTLRVADYNKDSFRIPGEDMEISVQFFPNLARNADGSVYSKGLKPQNPHFGLEVTQQGKKVFRGLLKVNEAVTFGKYRLVLNDLKHWIALSLVRENGLGLFFACAMVGLVGVLVRLVDPERRITALVAPAVDGLLITFFFYSKHFEGLLKEDVDAIIHRLQDGNAGA